MQLSQRTIRQGTALGVATVALSLAASAQAATIDSFTDQQVWTDGSPDVSLPPQLPPNFNFPEEKTSTQVNGSLFDERTLSVSANFNNAVKFDENIWVNSGGDDFARFNEGGRSGSVEYTISYTSNTSVDLSSTPLVNFKVFEGNTTTPVQDGLDFDITLNSTTITSSTASGGIAANFSNLANIDVVSVTSFSVATKLPTNINDLAIPSIEATNPSVQDVPLPRTFRLLVAGLTITFLSVAYTCRRRT